MVTENKCVSFTLIHLCVTNVRNSHSQIRVTERGKAPDVRLAPHPWSTSVPGEQPAAREKADRCSSVISLYCINFVINNCVRWISGMEEEAVVFYLKMR
jgi:hypothetical protein